MSLTKAQIRDRVGQAIGLVQVGQTMEDQDKTRIEQAYNEVYEELKEQSLNFWSLTGAIPDRFVPYVIALIVQNVNVDYSIPTERFARIAPTIQIAKLKISELGNQKYISINDPTPY